MKNAHHWTSFSLTPYTHVFDIILFFLSQPFTPLAFYSLLVSAMNLYEQKLLVK